jgi:hypothetical protein
VESTASLLDLVAMGTGVDVYIHMGGCTVCLMTDRAIRSTVILSVSGKGRWPSCSKLSVLVDTIRLVKGVLQLTLLLGAK